MTSTTASTPISNKPATTASSVAPTTSFCPMSPPGSKPTTSCGAYHWKKETYPPVLDIESTGKLTPSQLRDSALVWLRLIERRYGAKPILYTYYKFKTEYLGTPEFSKYPYWIAHYYVDTLRYDGPWKFWQHTDRGRIKGIKGYVDINCYNGSMYDLQQLTLK